MLSVFPTYEQHPLRTLGEAGFPVTLGWDDPPYFATSIGHEYEMAHEHFGYDRESLLRITENALDAAFSSEGVINGVRERLRAG